jgi:hypothetical protein
LVIGHRASRRPAIKPESDHLGLLGNHRDPIAGPLRGPDRPRLTGRTLSGKILPKAGPKGKAARERSAHCPTESKQSSQIRQLGTSERLTRQVWG